MENNKRVLIIGAGLGGLSAAVTLAQAGYKVEIFEKNDKIGGKLNRLQKNEFSFDLGPSIFTLPHIFEPLFKNGNKSMGDYIHLKALDPQWRNFFEDGRVVDLYQDKEKMRSELSKLDPDCHEGYERFLEYSKSQYDVVDKGYFQRGLDTFWEFFKFYGLFGATKMDFRRTMTTVINQYVQEPHLRDILQYFIKYVGSSANDAPAFMNLMPNIQIEFGLWYVNGGLYNLALGLEKRLKELGVIVHLNTEVKEVLRNGKIITGIKVSEGGKNESEIRGDYLISNMEVIPAYKNLFKEKPSFLKKYEKYEPSCSGIVLHLGLKKTYPQLAHHNFFYSKNQERHFDRVFHEKKLPDDPTIYLVAPSRTDSTQAPAGHENIKILPHIPYLNEKNSYTYEDYVAFKELVLDKLERMGLKDLRKNIILEDFWTPFDIEKKYYSNKGSIYGVVSDLKKNFAFKAPKKSKKYKNLFFVGGTVNPGGGMPMVVLSGQHVAKKIMEL
jgi:diapolycopene oxygenase